MEASAARRILNVTKEQFQIYLDKKDDRKITPVLFSGLNPDAWIEDFLRDGPTKEQFRKISGDLIGTPTYFWAIWSTR